MADADVVLSALVGGRAISPIDVVTCEQLPERAAWHGLSEFLLRRAAEGAVTLDAEASDRVAAHAAEARRRVAILDLELRRVARAVPERAAPPIVIKGPAVARRYPDPALRTYVDIDLLVPEGDLGIWRTALEALGYTGPTPWEERSARLAHHHLVYLREGPDRRIPVELHWRLFAERRARLLDYSALVLHCAPDPELEGVLVPELPALLVVLAVHLGHHRPAKRKLVWMLDFIELADPDRTGLARDLAGRLGVNWAMERALRDAELVLGAPRWQARPVALTGLAASRHGDRTGVRHHVAVARDLGPGEGIRYLLGRMDPRRFKDREGRFEIRRLKSWARRNLIRRR